MSEEGPITELVQRLRAGDAQAAEVLFGHYARQLGRVAEQHLSQKLAGRVNGEDVVQSVFRTFFRRCAQGEFQIDDSAKIWRLLVKITLQKARAQARHHTAAMRDVRAEAAEEDDAWLCEAVTRAPGPLEAVMLIDQIETLLRGLPGLFTKVLEMRLQGESVADVALKLSVTRQTVYRALTVLQQRLDSASRGDA